MADIIIKASVPEVSVLVEQTTLDHIDELAERAVALAPTAPRAELEPLFKEVDELGRAIEKRRKELKAPAKAFTDALDAAAAGAQEVLRPTRDLLGTAIRKHIDREEAERQAEIRRQREEAEAKQKAENEKASMAAAFAGSDEEPAAVVEHLPARIDPPRPPPPPKSSAIKQTTEYVLVIEDESLVPVTIAGACIRPIDEPAAKRLMRSGVKIPGLRLDEVKSFASKGAR